MGCGGSHAAHAEFEGVHVPELAGTWVPTRPEEWVNCPCPLEQRTATYRYVVRADGSWVDALWYNHKGNMRPSGAGEYVGIGYEPGKYPAKWSIGHDGVLTLRWGDHGEVVYYCVREGDPRMIQVAGAPENLSGSWYSLSRAGEVPNGDRYEFAREGQHAYKIVRHGEHGNGDNFAFISANTIKHAHGPSAVLQPNGDLHWDIEGGKWLSRRTAPAQMATVTPSTAAVMLSARPEQRLLRVEGTVTGDAPLDLASRPEVREFFPGGFLEGSAFAFAARITKVSHEANADELSRVFSFGNTNGGPPNSDFQDEIGVRSWPGEQCWMYAYGADGAMPNPIGYCNSNGGQDGWNLGETTSWLFTCSSDGHLQIFKEGRRVAETRCRGRMRSLRRKYLYIGAHPLWMAQRWRGSIDGALVWDREVTWQEMERARVETAAQEAPPMPLVVQAVAVPVEAVAVPVASASMHVRTLVEMSDLLKGQLGLSGNVAQVVASACEELGVATKGKSLVEQAREACAALGM